MKSMETNGMEEKVDRLSCLPDDIIGEILSFLPIQSAVATSVLSKQWTGLWKSITAFRYDKSQLKHSVFQDVIDRVLPNVNIPAQIHTFVIDVWRVSVVTLPVEIHHHNLNTLDINGCFDCYEILRLLEWCPRLRLVRLKGKIQWDSRKEYADRDSQASRVILSEELESLDIDLLSDHVGCKPIILWVHTRKLKFFRVSHIYPLKLKFIEEPIALQKADLKRFYCLLDNNEAMDFYWSVRRIPNLEVDQTVLSAIAPDSIDSKLPVFCNLNNVVFTITHEFVHRHSLLSGMIQLLQHTPVLECLTLNLGYCPDLDISEIKLDFVDKSALRCSLQRLKRFVVKHPLKLSQTVMGTLRYLLSYTTSLEQIVVVTPRLESDNAEQLKEKEIDLLATLREIIPQKSSSCHIGVEFEAGLWSILQ